MIRMHGKPYLDGKCQVCGKPTLSDKSEVLDEIIALVRYAEGYAYTEYLGEWCSEECLMKDVKRGRFNE